MFGTGVAMVVHFLVNLQDVVHNLLLHVFDSELVVLLVCHIRF